MNLDELRSVQNRERQTDSLQHLRESFYEEVGRYISDLKTERERAAERADDPWSDPEIQRLTDEIETAEEVAESIYERRMGKLVKSASLAAGGYTTDTEGLTLEEERLFENLVERIEENKATVLDVLAGEAADPGTSPAETTASQEQSATAPATQGEPDREPAPEPPSPEPAADATDEGIDAASMMAGDDGPADPVTATEPSDDPLSAAEPPSGDSPDTSDPEPPSSPSAHESTADPLAADPVGDERSDRPPVGSSDDQEETGVDDDPLAAGAGSDSATLDDRQTVRITSDIGQILGVDEQEYELSADDVVMLPEENAGPLIERDAAEPLE